MSFFRQPPSGTARGDPLSGASVDSACVAAVRERLSSTDFCRHILGAAKGELRAIEALATYFEHEPEGICTPLRPEDSFAGARVFGLFGDDLAGYRLAMVMLLALPTSPPGMNIAALSLQRSSDASNAPSATLASQATAPTGTGSLRSFYQELMRLRSGDGALASLGYDSASLRDKVLSFVRRNGQARALVVLNYGDAASASLTDLPPRTTFTPLLGTSSDVFVSDAAGQLGLPMPARSVAIYAC